MTSKESLSKVKMSQTASNWTNNVPVHFECRTMQKNEPLAKFYAGIMTKMLFRG